MEALDYWRLCDDLTVHQAAFLIVGEDPADDGWGYNNAYPKGYEAAVTALKGAISREKIQCNNTHKSDDSFETNQTIDWDETLLSVADLKEWLSGRGFTTGFFFDSKANTLPYLDDSNAYYAPKLAAAIKAWEEVSTNEQLLNNCSPKQALIKWLEVNGHKFGLTTSFEEVAKIANWQTKGGAPTTVASPLSKYEPTATVLDDEIPF